MSHELRLRTIEEVLGGALTVREACERLGVHRSTLWRLVKKYRAAGPEGLIHRLRGRPSNRSKPDSFKKQIREMFFRDYAPKGHSVHSFYQEVARTLPDYVCYATVLSWVNS